MKRATPRVPLVEREEVAPGARAAYDHVARSRGGEMPNVFKALANSPAALERIAAVGEFIRFQSRLDPVLRELVILTVARETRCAYEWSHHWEIAQRIGVAPALLAAVGTDGIETEPDPIGPAVRFARLVARAQAVDDGTFAAVETALGKAGVVELTVAVGYYGLLGRLLNTLDVPLEPGVSARPLPGGRPDADEG